ncbi:MAG: peptidase S10, partial [Saprospiraceae bacterium]
MPHLKKITFLLFFLICFISISAQENHRKNTTIAPPKTFTTNHQIINGGKTINYRAVASETYLKNKNNATVASIWSVAYVQEGNGDSKKRPVTFVFNGGPGSASMWLHMGLLGPEVVKVNSDAKEDDGAAPYDLVNNEKGILDLTDLVFVDPVGTGYSRVIGEGKVE